MCGKEILTEVRKNWWKMLKQPAINPIPRHWENAPGKERRTDDSD